MATSLYFKPWVLDESHLIKWSFAEKNRTDVSLKKKRNHPPGFMVLMTTTFLILFRIGAGCWSIQIFHILRYRYCRWKKSCTSWYGENHIICCTRFHTCQVVQDFLYQQHQSRLGWGICRWGVRLVSLHWEWQMNLAIVLCFSWNESQETNKDSTQMKKFY